MPLHVAPLRAKPFLWPQVSRGEPRQRRGAEPPYATARSRACGTTPSAMQTSRVSPGLLSV